jgi:hypothetical protein
MGLPGLGPVATTTAALSPGRMAGYAKIMSRVVRFGNKGPNQIVASVG